MSGLKIPLDFSPGSFYDKNQCYADHNEEHLDKSIQKSISDFIKLLINSPNGSFKPDPRFGFSLKNCEFENADSKDELKGKKIGGKSDNLNNYAKDLEKAISLFETRLQNLETETVFDKKISKLTISIRGMIKDEFRDYKQDIEFYIWKKQ
ncbi:MAG: hypothetical protein FWF70_08165 [Bacteroidetes bacterium]|nr:hypothetical protein [Bacteroidota bacterium]MCL1968226.1 hypothetical protein [Bacteroidota bacterium]